MLQRNSCERIDHPGPALADQDAAPLAVSQVPEHLLGFSMNDRHAWESRPPVLHELVWHQARSTPDATAFICEDRSITLAELASASAAWAARLREMGVVEGSHVALLLDHALETPQV